MGSSSGICIPQNSKKRVFPEGSSQPLNHKNKKLKQIQDVDAVLSSKALKSDKKGKGIMSSALGVTKLDSDGGFSDSFNGKDYMILSSDESDSEDEYAFLQSHFDNIDLPAGVEASIPQFSGSIMKKNKMTYTTGPANGSKTSAESGLRVQKGAMKVVQSAKKQVKTLHHKVSSGSVGTSSNNRHDLLEHVTDHGIVVQDSGNNDAVLTRYQNFKKFDIVEDYSDHHYAGSSSAMMEPPRKWAKKIQDEWRILEKDLPDMIFVRVYESRMDLLRAVIVGPEGTPYHDGLFFFDVCFPKNYPYDPPQVHYHSGGLRINPNLYHCGKVCLSLLNTWGGYKNEKWTPGVSTMFQVLLSIQGLILNEKPYFNEPGHERSSGSASGERRSLQYNERTLVLSLKTMVYTMKKPPKHFEDLVIGHFRNRAKGILTSCKAYMKGVRVGCGDEGEVTGSQVFKNDVKGYMKTLVGAFKQIGVVENLEEFLPPTQNFTQKLWAFFRI
ncbi:putative ubiquitin-conjugating enzyme E2 38 [Bidens hawaiensis]|uniref:putative ubiquitin-conjugating enzyme E2 38 n=1 Tax=Bidens hawaiensis TaxID=980011 RepID=UPI004049ED4E